MKIIFSRHAKRRIKLYGISERTIADIIKTMKLHQGDNEIIKDVSGFTYPLKIVLSVEQKFITVVTSYPLKKRRKK